MPEKESIESRIESITTKFKSLEKLVKAQDGKVAELRAVWELTIGGKELIAASMSALQSDLNDLRVTIAKNNPSRNRS